MLLAGLWYSKEKPTMNTFLTPLIDELNDLYENGKALASLTAKYKCIMLSFLLGITVQTTKGEIQCRAALLMCCCDLPARAIVLNQKQFNGMVAVFNLDFTWLPQHARLSN